MGDHLFPNLAKNNPTSLARLYEKSKLRGVVYRSSTAAPSLPSFLLFLSVLIFFQINIFFFMHYFFLGINLMVPASASMAMCGFSTTFRIQSAEKMAAETTVSECGVCGALHAREEDHAYEYANTDIIEVDLIDAITAQPIVDGVQLPCEHMFSRRSLLQWLATHHACPVCRTRATARDLKPVIRFVKNKLDELLVCKFCVR